MLCIVKPSFWFLVSIFGIYWLILVITLLKMESFLPSAPSIMPSTSAKDLPHVKDIRKLLGCDEANWDECVLAASKSAINLAPLRLQEITELLGCDEASWDECLLAASKFAKIQAVYAQQIATHRKEALQRALDGPTEYLKIKVFPEKHPVLVPLLPRYQPRPKWNVSIGIADVNIAGLPKAGSSQLHKILSTHRDARRFHRDKEKCMSRANRRIFEGWDDEPIDRTTASNRQIEVQKQLYKYYDEFFLGDINKSDKITVNACYWINDIEISWHYLRPQGKKSIFLFRDPADWLWSAFNFWRIHEIDPEEYGWVNEEGSADYRSPEFFHELVASGNKTKWGVYSHEYYQTFTIRSPRKLLALFGRENVLFLRNEDMLPEVVDKKFGVLDQLSNFTGLDRTGFDPSSYSSIVNCNDNKGVNHVCGQTRLASYASTGGREMLPETRMLIYLHFWEECKIWDQEFGIVYPDCLNVVERT